MATQCLGKNRDGGPCSGHVPAGRSWCQWHDPDREAERAAWRRKGGQNRSNKARARRKLAKEAMSLGDLDALLCGAVKDVLAGELEPGVASAAATLARAIAAVRSTGEIEQRLAALEVAAGLSEDTTA